MLNVGIDISHKHSLFLLLFIRPKNTFPCEMFSHPRVCYQIYPTWWCNMPQPRGTLDFQQLDTSAITVNVIRYTQMSIRGTIDTCVPKEIRFLRDDLA